MRVAFSRVLTTLLLIGFVSLGFVGCGGSGGGDSEPGPTSSAGGTGNVAILFTDGPADEFAEINVTVTKVELLGDDGRVTVYEGEKTFNLLELKDEAQVFGIRRDVPAGAYNKIRLTLSDLELVKKDVDGNVVETDHPKLPGNGKLDLNPRGTFWVSADKTLVVQIDMDANKSIHIVQTGSGKYQFRPVVFVDIISDGFPGKFVQVHGVIEDIDANDREFELCQTDIPVRMKDDEYDRDSRGCIEVAVVDDTSIFDANGMPTDFNALVEGEEATVFGRFKREDDGDDQSESQDGDDQYDDREMDDLELVASVIQLGPKDAFQALDGVAKTPVENDQFLFEVDAGQGFDMGTQVAVQLQIGTKIVNRKGEPLSVNDIQPGVPMRVHGVLDLGADPDILKASLIIIDMDANGQTKISGKIGDYPDNVCGLELVTDAGDRSVRIGDQTDIFLVTSMDNMGASEPIDVGDLMMGQYADVYGKEALDGCFDAETIIAFKLNN